ncbi:MAG: 50S ribosomal protein L4 [Candidatus Nealsonbacteria bacterium RBG_13_42_11]|uniref:Large ribosomal subunit protein uL4 n=1 Tax=Candidatus Nealsonbacteria bacterium RBG_13_42_11 TaxID=1801663 RepID=A0A1G2DZG0_9BACT|nr:MAG: 50S ribosomal protein L4 [Candidatus Nealsonbacteria bacterium RBG_13_42_11]
MKAAVYNQKGEETGTTLLPKEVFDVKLNPDLVYQVAVSQAANQRKVLANTKDRGEVSGGGKKPWRQKGTGRARHGSIRSPIWRGGGVALGPKKERVFKKKINIKMRKKALSMVLSQKLKNNLLIIIDDLKLEKAKTKAMQDVLKKLPSKDQSTLIALPERNQNIILAAGNLPKTEVVQAQELNCLKLLSFKYLILPKSSVKVIKETLIK